MRERLESSTWREKSVEEQQNRLGAIFGAAAAVWNGWKVLGLKASATGLKYDLRGGRATRHGWPGDPAVSRDAPGDPGTCAGRPGGFRV
jgi:hypothetical protein